VHESIFDPAVPLPRGPHQLTREQVAASQRVRLMAAFTALLAEHGYAAVTIGALAKGANVSRAAFYEHFADKEACLLAAYDHFAMTLATAMTAELADDTPWDAFVDKMLGGYLGTLQRDPVAARAFLVQMDGAGPTARRRRRDSAAAFAAMLAARHAVIRERNPALGPLPERVHLALVIAVRELARDALEEDPAADLMALAPDVVFWITATITGAGAAGAQRR
jgi:AcrR family transcriptional regulator